MKKLVYIAFGFLATNCVLFVHSSFASSATPFEGRISATTARGGAPVPLLYTIGSNYLRVEMTDTNWPNTVNILDRNSRQMTLVFPHNGTFVRLRTAADNSSAPPPGFPAMPAGLPPGIGPQGRPNPSSAFAMPMPQPMPAPPQHLPPGIGPTNLSGMPAMAAMPAPPTGLPPGIGPQAQAPTASSPSAMPNLPGMPGNPGMGHVPGMAMMPMMGEGMELQATGEKTNLLGYTCQRYDIKQRGQTMEIWATDQLLPFQVYLPHQPPRVGPPMIEVRWSELLTAQKLFPLLASLRFDNGVERYHFEVQSIMPAKLTDKEAKCFQTPEDYVELPARPF
jgi:hypothetical protein